MVLDFIPRNIGAARRMLRYVPGLVFGSWDNEPERALVHAVTEISLIMREMIDTLEIDYDVRADARAREKEYMDRLKPLHKLMKRALFAGANPNVYVSTHITETDGLSGQGIRPMDEAHPILRVAAHALDPEAVGILLKYGAKGNGASVSAKDGNLSLRRSILLSFREDAEAYGVRQPDASKMVEPRTERIRDLLEAYGAKEEREALSVHFTATDKGVVSPIEVVTVSNRDAPIKITDDRRVVGGGGSKGQSYTELGWKERQRKLAERGFGDNNAAVATGIGGDQGAGVSSIVLEQLLGEMERRITTSVVETVSVMLRDAVKRIEDQSQGVLLNVVEEVLRKVLDEKDRGAHHVTEAGRTLDPKADGRERREDRDRT
ncbi:MAG: hypothetical protein EB060_00860 [Proteobacteria bacterium]|nr:hypothetical protein [Pseudomonadota bacterium]